MISFRWLQAQCIMYMIYFTSPSFAYVAWIILWHPLLQRKLWFLKSLIIYIHDIFASKSFKIICSITKSTGVRHEMMLWKAKNQYTLQLWIYMISCAYRFSLTDIHNWIAVDLSFAILMASNYTMVSHFCNPPCSTFIMVSLEKERSKCL